MSSSKFPPDVIRHWPEVFKHIDVHTIPIQYVTSVHIHFAGGKEWIVDFDANKSSQKMTKVGEELEALLEEYEDEIVNVDFRMDTQKVKRDIQKKTRQFIKGKNRKDGSGR